MPEEEEVTNPEDSHDNWVVRNTSCVSARRVSSSENLSRDERHLGVEVSEISFLNWKNPPGRFPRQLRDSKQQCISARRISFLIEDSHGKWEDPMHGWKHLCISARKVSSSEDLSRDERHLGIEVSERDMFF